MYQPNLRPRQYNWVNSPMYDQQQRSRLVDFDFDSPVQPRRKSSQSPMSPRMHIYPSYYPDLL